jgi:hypothetical protein
LVKEVTALLVAADIDTFVHRGRVLVEGHRVQPDAVLDQWLVHSHVAAWLLNRNLDKAELGVEFMLDLLAVLVVEVGTLSASLLSRGGTVLSVRYNATAIDSSRILKCF